MKDLLIIDPPNIIPQHTLLGSLCVSSYLQIKGFSVDIANLNKLFYERTAGKRIVNVNDLNLEPFKKLFSQYTHIGISLSFYTHQTEYSIHICKWIKAHLPNVKIVTGGSAASFPTEGTTELFSLSDYYICGEGESPLEHILKGSEKQNIPNLATCFSLNEVTIQKSYIHDIEQLPFANYKQITWKGYCNKDTVDLFASKGCAWTKCTFCSFATTKNSSFRRKSKNRIKEEVLYYKKQDPNLISFIFIDEFLTLPLLEACSDVFLESSELKKCVWHCCIRADSRYTEDFIQKLKKSGLQSVSVGVESLHQETLDMLKKGITVDCIHHTVKLFRKYNIRVDVLAMYELPKQDEKIVINDLVNIKELCASTGSNLMLSRFILFREQAIVKEPEKYNLSKIDIETAMNGVSGCYLRNGKPLSFVDWAKTDGEGQKKFVINP